MSFNKVMFSSLTEHYGTPSSIYHELRKEFNFNFDPCPLNSEDRTSLLHKDWKGNAFVNPPYKNIKNFLHKGIFELHKGNLKVAVFLIPSRTDTQWWHNYVMRYADEIRFIEGRLKFNGAKNSAPFPSCVVVFRRGMNRTLSEFEK